MVNRIAKAVKGIADAPRENRDGAVVWALELYLSTCLIQLR